MNHLGVTTDPLTDDQRKRLPVDSSAPPTRTTAEAVELARLIAPFAQAAAPDGPTTDHDAAPDPELAGEDLFALVSFAMLLAPPVPEPLTPLTRRGAAVFDTLGCDGCHTPRVRSPYGPLPLYSDLLLHAMGPELADGLVMKEAQGDEFRTQPLWGVGVGGPYLHDGRAATLAEAIMLHGGEAAPHAARFRAAPEADRLALVAFLEGLGGRDQASPGLIAPDAPPPLAGELGGPRLGLAEHERERFDEGRAIFDRELGRARGVGAPRFNGDSCRACHFEPVVGGAGPRDVSVIRHGIITADGRFVPPAVGTILHRQTNLPGNANRPQPEANVFELRQTPHLFGAGLVDRIPDEAILAHADPDDTRTPDGISGRPSWTDGGRLGRFGWKAQVPSLDEFTRDAVSAELGMTLPFVAGLTFGRIEDNDGVPDPELTLDEAALLTDFMRLLAPPPRRPAADPEAAAAGEPLFTSTGCAACHVPSLPGEGGAPVPLYSDLLLHAILPPGARGIEDASAHMNELRTPPLWGLSQTPPYLHDGAADSIDEAIRAHDGEGRPARDRFVALPAADQARLLVFLETL